jgi:hypothetical protein
VPEPLPAVGFQQGAGGWLFDGTSATPKPGTEFNGTMSDDQCPISKGGEIGQSSTASKPDENWKSVIGHRSVEFF